MANAIKGRKGFQSRPIMDRLKEKFEVTENGCWNWIASKHPRGGYGMIYYEGRCQRAHRVAYQVMVGPVPEGLELDHLCHNPSCINPAHLEPVTHQENMMRGHLSNRLKTHCKFGHPFDEQNTIPINNGRRMCRTCNNERKRQQRAKASAARAALSQAVRGGGK